MHQRASLTTSLVALPPGSRARVASLAGGREFKHRLASLGIIPGAELTLCRGARVGPVVVEVRGGQFILGRGMAQRVFVKRESGV